MRPSIVARRASIGGIFLSVTSALRCFIGLNWLSDRHHEDTLCYMAPTVAVCRHPSLQVAASDRSEHMFEERVSSSACSNRSGHCTSVRRSWLVERSVSGASHNRSGHVFVRHGTCLSTSDDLARQCGAAYTSRCPWGVCLSAGGRRFSVLARRRISSTRALLQPDRTTTPSAESLALDPVLRFHGAISPIQSPSGCATPMMIERAKTHVMSPLRHRGRSILYELHGTAIGRLRVAKTRTPFGCGSTLALV